MQKTRKKFKRSKLDILLLIVFITSIIALIVSLSKYHTTKTTESSAKIAIPILDFNENMEVWNVEVSPNMETKAYVFGIANNVSEKISEVTMMYQILVKTR